MAVRPPNFIADFVSPILYFVPTNDIFSSILETMDAVNLRGAILIIGSLAWETEDKAINKELGLIRCRWREENLDMVNLKKVRCPIRYGRKSASRYNTYTMLFSNDTLINGTGLLVPLKDSVIITGNDFSNLFAQALLLAKAEGICKANEETLIKPWGTIAIHLSKSLEERHSEIYNNLKEYWTNYFSNGVHSENYRLGATENPSVTNNGFVNFELDDVEDVDFIFCTPVVLGSSKYPVAREISQQMNTTGYYTYFKENVSAGICTYMDEEILSQLPKEVSCEIPFENKPISFSQYPDTGGGLEQMVQDMRARLGNSIFVPSLEGLCFNVLKELSYPFKHEPGVHYDDVLRGIEDAKLKFIEQFEGWYPYVSKMNEGNVLKEFLSVMLNLEESPGEILERLQRDVLVDLNEINELIIYYESTNYIKSHLSKNILPKNHEERILFDFYKRNLNERQNILNYLFKGLKDRALQKSGSKNDIWGIMIFNSFYDRPYEFANPHSKRLFDHREIDLVGHRFERLPVKYGREFRNLYTSNKVEFYQKLQEHFSFSQVIHEIKHYLSILPTASAGRKAIFDEMFTFFDAKKWFGFYGLALSQVEGLFQEMINAIVPNAKAASLTDKVEFIRKEAKSYHHLDYYQYHIPFQRNKFMHSGIDSDVEIKSYDLLYDLHYLLRIYVELETPYMQVNSIIKQSDSMRFTDIRDYVSFFELLAKTKQSKHFSEIETEYSLFEKNFLCGHTDIVFLISEMAIDLPGKFEELYKSIIEFTTLHSSAFDLRSTTKKLVIQNPYYYRNALMLYFEYNSEKFIELLTYNFFIKSYQVYLPNLNNDAVIALKSLEKDFVSHFEVLEAVFKLFEN